MNEKDNIELYVYVQWPESQNYIDDDGRLIDIDCEGGPDGSLFVPLSVYNKVNNRRLTVVDKTYE